MPRVFIPFDGWSPGASYFGEGWSSANNICPFFGSNRPFRKFLSKANSTSLGPITSGYAHQWMVNPTASTYAADATTIYAGCATRLFTVDPSTGAFTDVSRAANYGGAGIAPAAFRFASIGNDIWAANWYDVPQRRTNNAGLFANGVVSSFVPVPRFISTIREHLVAANLNQAARFQDEIVWSDADDGTNFDPPTGTSTSLAGSKRLTAIPGQITGLLGGQYGLAFKRSAIFVLEYTGTVQVFRPDVLSSHVGTKFPGSIINSRYGIFFLGQDGFYQLSGLSAPTKISPPEIDQFLIDSGFDTQTAGSFTAAQEDTQAIGFQFPMLPLIGWAYRLTWGSDVNAVALFYNPMTQRWGHGSVGNLSQNGATAFVARHNAPNLWEALAAFTDNGSGVAKYAPLANEAGAASVNIWPPFLQLRFRPANFEEALHQQQSLIKGVLPIFSGIGPSQPVVAESVTVESLVDPHEDIVQSETAGAALRDTISGFYPFRTPGRFFRITVSGANEDFANFEGCWIEQELLT